MTLRAWSAAGLLFTLLAQAHPDVDRARGLVEAGRTDAGAAVLDSLLDTETLSRTHRAEITFLRATWSEDPDTYAALLRAYVRDFEDYPQAAEAELRLGRLAYARRQLEEALIHFDQAVDRGRLEEGHLWKGLCAWALGEAGSAEESLSKAAASGNAKIRQRALMALGDLKRRAREFDEAADYYARVREESLGGPGWWSAATYHMGTCFALDGNHSRAQELYLELVQRSPDSYEAGLCRDRILLQHQALPEPASALEAPEAYWVQVGAFTVQEHARTLLDSLVVLGFEAQIQSRDEVHRVMVGSFPSREQAESAGDSLDVLLKSGYQIIAHDER